MKSEDFKRERDKIVWKKAKRRNIFGWGKNNKDFLGVTVGLKYALTSENTIGRCSRPGTGKKDITSTENSIYEGLVVATLGLVDNGI